MNQSIKTIATEDAKNKLEMLGQLIGLSIIYDRHERYSEDESHVFFPIPEAECTDQELTTLYQYIFGILTKEEKDWSKKEIEQFLSGMWVNYYHEDTNDDQLTVEKAFDVEISSTQPCLSFSEEIQDVIHEHALESDTVPKRLVNIILEICKTTDDKQTIDITANWIREFDFWSFSDSSLEEPVIEELQKALSS